MKEDELELWNKGCEPKAEGPWPWSTRLKMGMIRVLGFDPFKPNRDGNLGPSSSMSEANIQGGDKA